METVGVAVIKKIQLMSSSTLGFVACNVAMLLLRFVSSLQLFDFRPPKLLYIV